MIERRCFFTDDGIEVRAVTEAEMREVDRIAIEETGPNLFQMMENAGRNLATLVIERLGAGWKSARAARLARRHPGRHPRLQPRGRAARRLRGAHRMGERREGAHPGARPSVGA